MKLAAVVLASVTAAAVTATPALAAAPQTAKDLTVKKADVKGGFKRTVSPGLKKGPVTLTLGSCGKITLVPKGGTISSEEFVRALPSGSTTQQSVDDLELTTILTPSTAQATTLIAKLKSTDQKCGIHVSSAPSLQHATHGFIENDVFAGTTDVDGTTVPVSGTSQVAFYQRGRALTFVQLDRALVTTSADGMTPTSIQHVVDSTTKAVLKTAAKAAIKALGAQTAA